MARRPRDEDERSDARERALGYLYEAETKAIAPTDVLAAQVITPDALTTMLVTGVERNGQRIDDLVAAHAKGWTLARMPSIDRNVLRLGTFELLERPDVDVPVVIDEAVALAVRFSTDDSGRFVNGVLAAIADTVRGGSARHPATPTEP
ncbi:MAG TPA: transcription antitermination factor NusB [Ilumatobacteraceae bacterium]|nr:transcription antitermination factor NusB [Ilumatobacteraceae bacterium]